VVDSMIAFSWQDAAFRAERYRSPAQRQHECRKWHQKSSVRPVVGDCSVPNLREANDFPRSDPVPQEGVFEVHENAI